MTLKTWLKTYKNLGDISICDLKGSEKLSLHDQYLIGAAMADIQNALSEKSELELIYNSLLKPKTK